MLRSRPHLLLLAALSGTAVVAACGSSSEGGGSNGSVDGGDGAGDDTPGADDDDTVPGGNGPDGSKLPDGATLNEGGTITLPDGAVIDADVPDASEPFDAGEIEDAGVVEDSGGGPVVDGPDDPPVAFPATSPPVFGYQLVDAFPGVFLSGAMDMEWPKGSNQPFVLQRGGHIVRLTGGTARTLDLNFETLVAAVGEGGTLGMALHPKFNDAGDPHPYVYVWYNAKGTPKTKQRLARFTYSAGKFDLASQYLLVEQTEDATEHNGAHLRFGPDGFLYFGNGDDTRTDVTTQKLNGGLFSGVFRIDVDQQGGAVSHAPPRQPLNCVTQGYYIPNDNPFVGVAGAMEEYYALGFRNPFSFNFDRANGNIWLGDVGDSFREEINLVEPGGNYGWPIFEGLRRNRAGATSIGTPKVPTADYLHSSLGDLTAIVAGYVYRGAALPELDGKFLFSDWPTGRLWAMDTATGVRTSLVEANYQNAPVGFGQDAAGEIYLVSWSKILKLTRAAPHGVPAKLSQTKIFRNLETLKTPSVVHPYSIKSPLWSDGAVKSRFVYVPAGQKATMTASGTVTLPTGSMLIKHFELPPETQPVGGRTRRLETRILVAGTDTTYGITYRWNAAGTDADLVTDAIHETITDADPAETRDWHFPSTGECWSCHRAENRVLAFRGEQMNFTIDGTNQLATLAAANVFTAGSIGTSPAPIASPSDATATNDARASAYLAANCAPCHHPGASYLGGGQTWNANPNVAANSRGLIGVGHNNYPMASALGLGGSPLVAKGNPNNSILLARMKTNDADLKMPPIGRYRVDPVGTAVLQTWIQTLP